MSVSVEHEIHVLLNEKRSFESIGDHIIKKLESSDYEWTTDHLNVLYQFLLRSGQPQILIEFIVRHLKNKNFTIPWGHFIEAIQQLYDEIDPQLIKIFKKGLKETDGKYEACRSSAWDPLIAEMVNWRSQKKWEYSKNAPLRKKELLEKVITLRTQQLFEAEKNLLRKLEKMFPGDPDILKEVHDAKERQAYEILNRYSRVQRKDLTFDESEETAVMEAFSRALIETQKNFPEMSFDLAVAAWMLEAYEASYQILSSAEKSISQIWMRCELQLKTRRYLELLDELNFIERNLASDPETFFATAFLRAQALWGLGQNHMAIEILESLLASRPTYRSASALLNHWRGL